MNLISIGKVSQSMEDRLLTKRLLTSLEICAGAGGQALGLEQAGFDHMALVEIDHHACSTLVLNRPNWNVIQADITQFSASNYCGIDLLAGGIPCPPFSRAGKQLGQQDERNLFPEVLRIVGECLPKAIMIENVKGLLDPVFQDYRLFITRELESCGYAVDWKLLNACDFGVPQLRPRTVMVALLDEYKDFFIWPLGTGQTPPTAGEALLPEMLSYGWELAEDWAKKANKIAPTIVGGSKKHGGPDLGPTRAKKAWAAMGVDGSSIADEPPCQGFGGIPKLTVRMAGILQGFPHNWVFAGRKTPAYRQVGNAFPPPVAKAVGESIHKALIQGGKCLEKGIA